MIVDRGFEIQDLILKQNLLLNIPPFKATMPSLSVDDVTKTQKIARLRIHVERAIGHVKSRFHVFDDVIPLTLSGFAVASTLTNFLPPLIAESG